MGDLIDAIKTFFSSLFFGETPEVMKRRELRKIYRELRKPPFHYYRASTNEVLPAFADSVYKFAIQVRTLEDLFSKTILNENSKIAESFKNYILESKLDDKTLGIKEKFTFEAVFSKLSTSMSIKSALEEINNRFREFMKAFDSPEFLNFDSGFTQLDRLAALSRHDFEKLLSFFDPDINLRSKDQSVHFSPAIGAHMIQELMDIYFLFAELDLETGVSDHVVRLLEKLKTTVTDSEIDKIHRIISKLDSIHKKQLPASIFQYLLQAIHSDPNLVLEADRGTRTFLELYRSKLLSRFELSKEKAVRERNQLEFRNELRNIFQDKELVEIKGYDDALSNLLEFSGFPIFSHLLPFRVLKSFLIYFFEPSIKETLKKLVINSFFEDKSFKDSFISLFHATQSAIEKIVSFEDSLFEAVEESIPSIKEYLSKHEKGKQVGASLSNCIESLNTRARDLIEDITNDFYSFFIAFSKLIDDSKQHAPAIISNIRVISGDRNHEFLEQLAGASKKLSIFLEAMRHFTVIHPNNELSKPQGS
ncbi:MAG: hypothetical protein JW904_14015 [Spirochaetales bacterium]|nr:hypothetical protein [Spirochaetales bacterium]